MTDSPAIRIWKADNLVATFNQLCPVGTPVTYYPIAGRKQPAREAETRSKAWVLPNGEPLVSIDGVAGGVSLFHLVAMERAEDGRVGETETKLEVGTWLDVYDDNRYYRYGTVVIDIDDAEQYIIGVVVGVPAYMRSTCQAAGGVHDSMLTAWYQVPSDWEGVSESLAGDILEAISSAARRLWSETKPEEVE